jgi:hypothetical protein
MPGNVQLVGREELMPGRFWLVYQDNTGKITKVPEELVGAGNTSPVKWPPAADPTPLVMRYQREVGEAGGRARGAPLSQPARGETPAAGGAITAVPHEAPSVEAMHKRLQAVDKKHSEFQAALDKLRAHPMFAAPSVPKYGGGTPADPLALDPPNMRPVPPYLRLDIPPSTPGEAGATAVVPRESPRPSADSVREYLEYLKGQTGRNGAPVAAAPTPDYGVAFRNGGGG